MMIEQLERLHAFVFAAALTLIFPAAAAATQVCTVTVNLDEAVTIGALEFAVDYSQADGVFLTNPANGFPDCVVRVPNVLGGLADNPGQQELSGSFLSVAGFTGPTALADCVFETNLDVLTPGHFAATASEATDPGGSPVDPLPALGVSLPDCGSGTTTTLPPTTTTLPGGTLTTTTTLPQGTSCSVIFSMVDPVLVGALQFAVDYTTAPGEFLGSGPGLDCVGLAPALSSFNDNDDARELNLAFISLSGFTGLIELAECFFEATDIPAPSDFLIDVAAATDPELNDIEPFPSVVVGDILCDTSTTSTLPTPTTSTTSTTVPDPTSCDIVFGLDDAVTLGSLQFAIDYSNAPGEFAGTGAAVDCIALVEGALASANDQENIKRLDAGLISLGGFAGPMNVMSCAFEPSNTPVPGDFLVAVIAAGTPEPLPVIPLPDVIVSSIECSASVTTTTVTLSTSTTMFGGTTTTTIPEVPDCDIVFVLEDDRELASLQWDTAYGRAAGDFDGSGTAVECTNLVAGALASYNDNEGIHVLGGAMIDLSGFSGPRDLARCSFTATGAVLRRNFTVTVIDAADTNANDVLPLPAVDISLAECEGPTTTTTVPVCGNGIPQSGEDCDDGNGSNTDACLNDCTDASCGDGFVRTGTEECDDGGGNSDVTPDACRSDCALPTCGDGVTDPAFDEDCDDGQGNSDVTPDACRSGCTLPVCGDSVTDPTFDEDCDDANTSNEDACLNGCTDASCGDGFVHDGVEDCDDANTSNEDVCLDDCTDASCGDGFVYDGVEECDDGNTADGDGCSAVCEFQRVCGDANDDGKVTTTDSLIVLKAAVNPGVECPLIACDVDNSGDLSTTDALKVLKKAVGADIQLVCPV